MFMFIRFIVLIFLVSSCDLSYNKTLQLKRIKSEQEIKIIQPNTIQGQLTKILKRPESLLFGLAYASELNVLKDLCNDKEVDENSSYVKLMIEGGLDGRKRELCRAPIGTNMSYSIDLNLESICSFLEQSQMIGYLEVVIIDDERMKGKNGFRSLLNCRGKDEKIVQNDVNIVEDVSFELTKLKSKECNTYDTNELALVNTEYTNILQTMSEIMSEKEDLVFQEHYLKTTTRKDISSFQKTLDDFFHEMSHSPNEIKNFLTNNEEFYNDLKCAYFKQPLQKVTEDRCDYINQSMYISGHFMGYDCVTDEGLGGVYDLDGQCILYTPKPLRSNSQCISFALHKIRNNQDDFSDILSAMNDYHQIEALMLYEVLDIELQLIEICDDCSLNPNADNCPGRRARPYRHFDFSSYTYNKRSGEILSLQTNMKISISEIKDQVIQKLTDLFYEQKTNRLDQLTSSKPRRR